jgi:hypothetical protein
MHRINWQALSVSRRAIPLVWPAEKCLPPDIRIVPVEKINETINQACDAKIILINGHSINIKQKS